MIQASNYRPIWSKRKAISALLPYAIRLERRGHLEMIDLFSRTADASDYEGFMWNRVKPFVAPPFDRLDTAILGRITVLTSPHIPWGRKPYDARAVVEFATEASFVPCMEEVGQSVVDTLLRIASVDALRPHIPVGVWAWLKRRPALPPGSSGRSKGTKGEVVRLVRALGDIEILKSYLLLVWSEWGLVDGRTGLAEMRISIREDFGGVGMGQHREDLLERLDRILERLDCGSGHLGQHELGLSEVDVQMAKEQYGELRRVLLEVGEEAVNMLVCSTFLFCFFLSVFCGLLTARAGMYRIPLDFHVRSTSPVYIISREEKLGSLPTSSELQLFVLYLFSPMR